MVVLFLALLVRPVVGAHLRLDDELVAFARIAGQGLSEGSEGYEPQTGDGFPSCPLLVSARIVIADQQEAGVRAVVLGDQLRISGEITDGKQGETVHEDPP